MPESSPSAPAGHRGPVPVHLAALSVYPVLHLYLVNRREIPFADILPHLAAALALGGFAAFLLRRRPRAAALASLAVFLFLNYTTISILCNEALRDAGLASTRHLLRHRHFLALLAGAVAATWFALRRVRDFSPVAGFLNAFALALVALQALQMVAAAPAPSPPVVAAAPLPETPPPLPARPDIYLVVPDSYAGAATLAEYGFDNRPFLDELRRRGFLVAEGIRANYAFTLLSLASLLNLDHIDRLVPGGVDSENRLPCVELIRGNALFAFARRAGYRLVSFASGANFLAFPHADHHLKPRFHTGEFTDALIRSTPLAFFLEAFGIDYHIQSRTLHVFENLPAAAALPSPKLVFAHIYAPHAPFVFGADGGRPTATTEAGRYLDQVRFVNRRLLEAVDGILARSATPPAILILADHGVFPFGSVDPIAARRQRMDVLCALLLSPGAPAPPAPDTSLGAMRLLVNACFALDLPVRMPRVFYSDQEEPFRLEELPAAPR